MEQQAAAAKLQERAAAGLARAKARAEKHVELQAARVARAKDMYQAWLCHPFCHPFPIRLARAGARARASVRVCFAPACLQYIDLICIY